VGGKKHRGRRQGGIPGLRRELITAAREEGNPKKGKKVRRNYQNACQKGDETGVKNDAKVIGDLPTCLCPTILKKEGKNPPCAGERKSSGLAKAKKWWRGFKS